MVFAGRRADRLQALVAELGDAGLAVPYDVTSWPEQQALVARTLASCGHFDAGVSNASAALADDSLASDPTQWEGLVQTNLLGVDYTIEVARQALIDRRGDLVVTESVNARMEVRSHYGVTKWAVAKLTEQARVELGREAPSTWPTPSSTRSAGPRRSTWRS